MLGLRNLDVSHTGISCGIDDNDLLMSQYSVAGKTGESTRKPWKDQDQPFATNTSSKIVNISVNVSDVDGQKFVQESEAGADKSGFPLMKENNSVSVGNGNNPGSAPPANSKLSPLPPEPADYNRGATIDITLYSSKDLSKKEKELQVKEAELKKREKVCIPVVMLLRILIHGQYSLVMFILLPPRIVFLGTSTNLETF